MTELGKVLKGLKLCMGKESTTDILFLTKECDKCPYCEMVYSETGSYAKMICHHKELMQDAIDILTRTVKINIRQEKQLKDQTDWIKSWDACNYS